MEKLRLITGGYLTGLFLLLTSVASGPALGDVINSPQCTEATCTWDIKVNGEVVMMGSYESDPETGDISFGGTGDIVGDGYTVSLDNMYGNIDPVLGWGLGASNTSGAPLTFAFAFSLPLGGLTGDILTHAELGTTLSAFTSLGGSVFPTLGGGNIVDSQDIRFSTFSSVDKGVDIGDGTSIGTQGTMLDFDSADGLITLVGGYDLMSVTIAFGLTNDTGVGFSGFVEQTIAPAEIPVPAAVWLFASGLIGLIGVARRRK